jgi:hypothetical protein
MKRKAGKSGSSTHMGTATETGKPAGRLDRDIQSKIGQQLRSMYDDVVKEGVPDRFVDFLRRLQKRD